jgi:hypothetical protein
VYGGRYRVVYKIKNEDNEIHIHAVGIRREGDKTMSTVLLKNYLKQDCWSDSGNKVPGKGFLP